MDIHGLPARARLGYALWTSHGRLWMKMSRKILPRLPAQDWLSVFSRIFFVSS